MKFTNEMHVHEIQVMICSKLDQLRRNHRYPDSPWWWL